MDEEFTAEVVQHQPCPYSETNWMWVLWAYPLMSLLLMAVNLFFIVHAIKTGRPFYWIWIIFVMPVLGAAAYFIIEMRPNLRSIDWAELKWRFAAPQTRIAALNEVATKSPTVKNRMRLAREFESQGKWTLAANTYRECLNGVFHDDARLMICLACAVLEEGKFDQAHEIIGKVPDQRDHKLDDDRKLSLLRCQAAVGNFDDAIGGLEELASRKSSLDARFFLAQAKALAGHDDEANADLKTLLETYRNGSPLFRKHELHWYAKAQKMLKRKPDLTRRDI